MPSWCDDQFTQLLQTFPGRAHAFPGARWTHPRPDPLLARRYAAVFAELTADLHTPTEPAVPQPGSARENTHEELRTACQDPGTLQTATGADRRRPRHPQAVPPHERRHSPDEPSRRITPHPSPPPASSGRAPAQTPPVERPQRRAAQTGSAQAAIQARQAPQPQTRTDPAGWCPPDPAGRRPRTLPAGASTRPWSTDPLPDHPPPGRCRAHPRQAAPPAQWRPTRSYLAPWRGLMHPGGRCRIMAGRARAGHSSHVDRPGRALPFRKMGSYALSDRVQPCPVTPTCPTQTVGTVISVGEDYGNGIEVDFVDGRQHSVRAC